LGEVLPLTSRPVRPGITRTSCGDRQTIPLVRCLASQCRWMSRKVIIVVSLAVLVVIAVFLVSAYLVTIWLRIPQELGLPLPVRFVGALLLLSGFVLLGWLFRYRRPVDILTSTYVTFSKAARGQGSLGEQSGRTELLVVRGPYRYVRHPLYSDVVLLLLGWWLLLDCSFLLVSALFLLLWFSLVVTRFEERELKALFGGDYEKYASRVPRIIPFTSKLDRLIGDLDRKKRA